MWGVEYDDGRGTEWEERDWAEGCRDQASRSDRWMPNYSASEAHEAAGRPKSWLWAAWDGSTLIAEDGQVLARHGMATR